MRADAMVANLTADAIAALARDPSVAYVEEDHLVHLLQSVETPPAATDPVAPVLVPWGIGGGDPTAGGPAPDAGGPGEGRQGGGGGNRGGAHAELAVVVRC